MKQTLYEVNFKLKNFQSSKVSCPMTLFSIWAALQIVVIWNQFGKSSWKIKSIVHLFHLKIGKKYCLKRIRLLFWLKISQIFSSKVSKLHLKVKISCNSTFCWNEMCSFYVCIIKSTNIWGKVLKYQKNWKVLKVLKFTLYTFW